METYIVLLAFFQVTLGLVYNLPEPLDLSYVLGKSTHFWDPTVSFELVDKVAVNRPGIGFYAANKFRGAEHGGTHLDAPFHFNQAGITVDKIPLNRLISKEKIFKQLVTSERDYVVKITAGFKKYKFISNYSENENCQDPKGWQKKGFLWIYSSGILIDVQNETKSDRNFQLSVEHINQWQQKNGPVPDNVIVLINFGWAAKYSSRQEYFGNSTPPYSFPGISKEAASWFVNSKKVFGVGIDVPSVDYGKSTNFETHQILHKGGLYAIENVALNNTHLPSTGFDLIVMPLKIQEGSGGPCRLIAL